MADANQASGLPEINSLLPAEACIDGNQGGESQVSTTDQTMEAQMSTAGKSEGVAMSKSAMKKLRKKEEWEAGREDRKTKRREQRKAKQTRRREAKAAGEVVAPRPVKQRPLVQTDVPITIVLDCSFDSLMTEKEIISLCGQTSRCYHDIKIGRYRPLLAVTSFGGRMKERFEVALQGHYKSWKGVQFVEEDISKIGELAATWMKDIKNIDMGSSHEQANIKDEIEVADETNTNETTKDVRPTSVVYLSADSPDTLTTLEPDTCYIIGGLVDRNRYKGICFEAARKAGIPTARLPIGDFISMRSRQVLTTNHVVEIMVKYMETQNWAQSFLEVIPMRKGAGSKSLEAANGADDEDEDDVEQAEDENAPNESDDQQSPQ
jgi:tRNA (guanine9-N1)-methyltransferase